MTSKLLLILISILLTIGSKGLAQSISFEYDKSGNCKLKYKTVVLARAQSNHKNEQVTNTTDSTHNEVSAFGERKVIIYPNPTKGFLRIELNGEPPETKIEYRLTDLNGKLIMHGQFDFMWSNLDLSQLTPGTYMLHIYMDKKKDVWKILKE